MFYTKAADMFALLQQQVQPVSMTPSGAVRAEKLKPKTYDEIRQRVEEERRQRPTVKSKAR